MSKPRELGENMSSAMLSTAFLFVPLNVAT